MLKQLLASALVLAAALPAHAQCPICPQGQYSQLQYSQVQSVDFSSFGQRIVSLEQRVSVLEARMFPQQATQATWGTTSTFMPSSVYAPPPVQTFQSASYVQPSYSAPAYYAQSYSAPAYYAQSYAAPAYYSSNTYSSCPGGVCAQSGGYGVS